MDGHAGVGVTTDVRFAGPTDGGSSVHAVQHTPKMRAERMSLFGGGMGPLLVRVRE